MTIRIASICTAAALLLASYAGAGAVTPRIVSTPNAKTVAYSLPPGAVSPDITIPSSTPVHLMGVQLRVGFRSVGQATLLSISGAGGFIAWVGLDSTPGAAITEGISGVAGTKILFIDDGHCVAVEVASATAIRVHNTCAGGRFGRVTLFY